MALSFFLKHLKDVGDGLRCPLLQVIAVSLMALVVLILRVVVFLEVLELSHGFSKRIGVNDFYH
jgi:hypothetical protein